MGLGGLDDLDFQRIIAWVIVVSSMGGPIFVALFKRSLLRRYAVGLGVTALISYALTPIAPLSMIWLYREWGWSAGSSIESGLLTGMFSGFMFRADPWFDIVELVVYPAGLVMLALISCALGPLLLSVYTSPTRR